MTVALVVIYPLYKADHDRATDEVAKCHRHKVFDDEVHDVALSTFHHCPP